MSKESKAGYEKLKGIKKRAREKEREVLEAEIKDVAEYLEERYKALQGKLPDNVHGLVLTDYNDNLGRILTLEKKGVKILNLDKERKIVGEPIFISVDQYFEECLSNIDNIKDRYWFLDMAFRRLLESETYLMSSSYTQK